jgi:phosphohistidine phosphatase
MLVYFVRHATAANKSGWSADDDLRPLTPVGAARFSAAATALAAAGSLTPQLIVSSPLVRATQTAELLCRVVPAATRTVIDARLGHSFSAADFAQIIANYKDHESIAIIGHNPSFAAVLAAVIGDANIDVRKGSVALVDIIDASAPEGCLMWLAPPSLFGRAE